MISAYRKLINAIIVFVMLLSCWNTSGVFAKDDADITIADECTEIKTVVIDDETFLLTIEENTFHRRVTAVDQQGMQYTAVYNKLSDSVIYNGEVYSGISELEGDGILALGRTGVVLESNTYSFGPTATAVVGGLLVLLASISNIGSTATNIVEYIAGVGAGKTLSITVSKRRSYSKMTSGPYTGKYQFWTNVYAVYDGSAILSEDHSNLLQCKFKWIS